jgi:hypothetical protein
MTFVAYNFDDVQEAKPAPAGRYALQITAAEVVQSGERSKNPGRPQYKVSIGFKDEPNVPNMRQYLSLPHEDDEQKSAEYKALLLKRFCHLFGVKLDSGGFDIEGLAMEMVGAEATAEVKLGAPNDSGDVYNELVVPKIPNEGTGKGSPPRRGR